MANLTIAAADVRMVTHVEKYTAPAGEAITAGQAVRFDTSTGKFTKANGSDAAEARIFGVALNTAAANEPVTALRRGVMNVGAALAGMNYDAAVYLSDTDGTLADSAGTVSTVVGRVVPGFASTTPDKLLHVAL